MDVFEIAQVTPARECPHYITAARHAINPDTCEGCEQQPVRRFTRAKGRKPAILRTRIAAYREHDAAILALDADAA